MAEKWQDTERKIVKKLKPKITKIKAVFRGDEQYMILSTLYRQNHYHPVYALRSSFGILIQIPFFLAAYSFLSHLEALKGVSFLFIRDLSEPDTTGKIGDLAINVLPVAMTLINIIAGFIYTRGLSAKEKVQIYLTALVFLVLLYNSPAGLVLYWTMNNVFSLVKNIFYKIKNPLKVLYLVLGALVLAFICYLLFFNPGLLIKRIAVSLGSLLYFLIPLLVKFINYFYNKHLIQLNSKENTRRVLILTSGIILMLLAGLYIPGTVISSSPEEFSFIDSISSPFSYIYYALSRSAGLFVFWPLCIYLFFGNKIKTFLTMLLAFFSSAAIVHVFLFQGNYGFISNTFTFSTTGVLAVSKISLLINLAILLALFIVLLFIFTKAKLRSVNYFFVIVILSLSILSARSLIAIGKEYHTYTLVQNTEDLSFHKTEPIFFLSKEKPNIIIIMADCAINSYVKSIFEEHPELNNSYDGFTLYTNTVSFAGHTIMGVPPVWGGYEYTPLEMNRRSDVPLADKHNEALLTLPILLTGAGYHVTITDPSLANYSNIPDTRIYNGHDNMTAMNLTGRYNNIWYMENDSNRQLTSKTIIKNILWFSFLKISPTFLRSLIYYDGTYLSAALFELDMTEFMNSYSTLDYLSKLTTYDSQGLSALLISNETTHALVHLNPADYTPSATDRSGGDVRYEVNSAFYLKFGEFLEALKKNGVYDNTRIIIASDHGADLGNTLSDTGVPIEYYSALLMVKDFNERGKLKYDPMFMTNADVPLMALKNIVTNPVNPFTGNPLTAEPKNRGVFITTNHMPNTVNHGKYQFNIRKDQWLFVHDDILDKNDWSWKEP
jgi:YidC/Oxa1 family membrane protein insertase